MDVFNDGISVTAAPCCQVEFSLRLTALILVVSACCVCVCVCFCFFLVQTVKQEKTWCVRSESTELLQGLLAWVRAQWEAMFGVKLHTSLQDKAAWWRGRAWRRRKDFQTLCVCVFCEHGSACWYWKMFVFIFSPRSLHSVCSHYPRCFLRLSGWELGNDCTHSCGTQACKSTGCIMFPSRYQLFCSWNGVCLVSFFSCHVFLLKCTDLNGSRMFVNRCSFRLIRSRFWEPRERKESESVLAVSGCTELWHHALNTRPEVLLKAPEGSRHCHQGSPHTFPPPN